MASHPRPTAATRRSRSAKPKTKTARKPPGLIGRILVPIDFSDRSKGALNYAAQLAARFNAKVIPLHVIEPVIYPSDMAFAPLAAELPAQVSMADMKRKLRAWCQGVLPERAMEAPVVRIGQAFHEIALAAKGLKADLLVISTHGYTGFKHVLLGSTAERVVRHAPCPVLTLRRSS